MIGGAVANLRAVFVDFAVLPGSFPPRVLTNGSGLEFAGRVSEKSVRRAIWQHKRLLVDVLFDGFTSEEEEDAALSTILSAESADELTFMVNVLTWDGLDDDLDEPDLDQIAQRLSQLLDHRDYTVDALLRRIFGVDADSLPPRSDADLSGVVRAIPPSGRSDFLQRIQADRDRVLNGIALMALRGLATHVREFRLVIAGLQAGAVGVAPLGALDWEAFYTDRICAQLA